MIIHFQLGPGVSNVYVDSFHWSQFTRAGVLLCPHLTGEVAEVRGLGQGHRLGSTRASILADSRASFMQMSMECLTSGLRLGVLVAQKGHWQKRGGQHRKIRQLLWNTVWNGGWFLWREADGALWGAVRHLEASFELDEELALFCPWGTHTLNCDCDFSPPGGSSPRQRPGYLSQHICPQQMPMKDDWGRA